MAAAGVACRGDIKSCALLPRPPVFFPLACPPTPARMCSPPSAGGKAAFERECEAVRALHALVQSPEVCGGGEGGSSSEGGGAGEEAAHATRGDLRRGVRGQSADAAEGPERSRGTGEQGAARLASTEPDNGGALERGARQGIGTGDTGDGGDGLDDSSVCEWFELNDKQYEQMSGAAWPRDLVWMPGAASDGGSRC